MTRSEVGGQRRYHTLGYVVVDVSENLDDIAALHQFGPGPEDYIDGRYGVHVHLSGRIKGLDPQAGDLCASFERTSMGFPLAGQLRPVRLLVTDDSYAIEHRSGCEQEAVFVHDVEFLEAPEGIEPKAVPTVVRLQRLDDCLRFGMPRPDLALPSLKQNSAHGAPSPPVLPPAFIPKDRELGLLDYIKRQRIGIGIGESERQRVEAAPEVVEELTDPQAEVRRRRWYVNVERRIARSVCIRLMRNRTLIRTGPFIDLGLEPFQVLMRPVQLEDVTLGNPRHA
jgi:hypothetical protein